MWVGFETGCSFSSLIVEPVMFSNRNAVYRVPLKNNGCFSSGTPDKYRTHPSFWISVEADLGVVAAEKYDEYFAIGGYVW
jgi:hypothetical protein